MRAPPRILPCVPCIPWSILFFLFPWFLQSAQPPNILFIFADDIGYEALNSYGGQDFETPHLNRMAETGLRFSRAYTSSVCTPSRVSMHTGLYTTRHRHYKVLPVHRGTDQKVDFQKMPTYAQLMRENGYATSITGKWQLATLEIWPEHIRKAGFDSWCVWQIWRDGAKTDRHWNPTFNEDGVVRNDIAERFGPDVLADYVIEQMTEAVEAGKPFLIVHNELLPHWPVIDTPDDRALGRKPSLKGMIAYMDKLVGRLLDALESSGLHENTYVFFMGDNGTWDKDFNNPRVGDHPDELKHTRHTDAGRVNGGKAHPGDAGAHVPLLAWGPKSIPSGAVNDDLVDVVDLFPTFCELSNTTIPESLAIDGRSIAPQLHGRPGIHRAWTHQGLGNEEYLFDGSFRLFRKSGELLDARNLPAEPKADESDPAARAARKKLEAIFETITPNGPRPPNPSPQKTTDHTDHTEESQTMTIGKSEGQMRQKNLRSPVNHRAFLHKTFLCGLCGLWSIIPWSDVHSATDQPNILYILADDLGFSDLGCFGGEIDTPTLDALAANGVRLTQFYNTGRCCPSRAALLTGQYPHRVGLGHMTTNDLGHPGFRGRVSDDAQTIAQALQPASYRSYISGKWHLGTPDPTRNGFEEFYGTLVSAKRFFDPTHLVRFPEDHQTIQYPEGEFYATDAVTDHALQFLRQHRKGNGTTEQRNNGSTGQPWFLYLAYNAPHFPLHAPKEDIAKYKDRYHEGWDVLRDERHARMKQLGLIPESTRLTPRSTWRNYGETRTGTNPAWNTLPEDRRLDLARRMAIYAAMVDRLDAQLGRIIDDLRENGELEHTLIVFTSDNGACFEWDPFGFDIKSSNQNILHTGDQLDEMGTPGTFHSVGSGWANAGNTPWRMYKHFVHEGGVASPGIVHWPAGLKTKPGSIIHEPAHIIDLLPTALAAANTTYEGTLPLPGTDLIAQLNNGKTDERTLFFEHQGNRAIRQGNWKLVAFDDQPWELYDFRNDRTELNDLSNKYPEKVKELEAAWDLWAEQNNVTPLPRDLKVPYLKAN